VAGYPPTKEILMLELIQKMTCSRCGTDQTYKEEYDRIREGEFRTNARHFFFMSMGWAELNDDLRHLCPDCAEDRKGLQADYDIAFNKWIEEGKNVV
jgi:hypothetical protein